MGGEIAGDSAGSKRVSILGPQLRKARETIKFDPEEVAGHLGIPAAQIRDWEAERARPSLMELEQLARLYGRDIDYFLKDTPAPPAQIQFRSSTRQSFREVSGEARLVMARFDELCRAAAELEHTLGKPPLPEIRSVPQHVFPSDLATQERSRLGLGEKPVRNLRSLIGREGIRIFELPVLHGEFAGFSYHHRQYGACILINAKDVPGRRNFSLAHEYAHLLYRHAPCVCDISQEGRPAHEGDERSADIFAIEFLLPEEPVRQDFRQRGLPGRPSLQNIGRMAGKWRVSVQAMTYRLEDLRLVDPGYSSELLASYKPPHPMKGRAVPTWRRRLGERFVSDAIEAYQKGHISLGKLAHYLGLPLRKALETAEPHTRTR